MIEPEDPCESLLDRLLTEVEARYQHLLPAEALEEIHEALADLVLASPEGRALLRDIVQSAKPTRPFESAATSVGPFDPLR